MMREARVMRLQKHVNIVKLYGYIVDEAPYLLVMEYCEVLYKFFQLTTKIIYCSNNTHNDYKPKKKRLSLQQVICIIIFPFIYYFFF